MQIKTIFYKQVSESRLGGAWEASCSGGLETCLEAFVYKLYLHSKPSAFT